MEIEIDETKLDELIVDAKDASFFTGSNISIFYMLLFYYFFSFKKV